MALNTAAALAAATTYADAEIAAHPDLSAYRDVLIATKTSELEIVFAALIANGVVLPDGSPALNSGGFAVSGKGRLT